MAFKNPHDLTDFVIYIINVTKFIFPVIYLKAMHLTGQNDWPTESLSKQNGDILAGPCPLAGYYF